MDKEGESPQTIFNLWHEFLEWVDVREVEEDPLAEEDVRGEHQACQEADHQVGHPEETTTTETGTISRETMKAVT